LPSTHLFFESIFVFKRKFPLPDLDPSRGFPLKESFPSKDVFLSKYISLNEHVRLHIFPSKNIFGCHQKTLPNRWKEDASQKLRGGSIKWTLRKSIKKHTFVYLWLPTPRVTSYFLTSQVSAPKKEETFNNHNPMISMSLLPILPEV